MKRVNNRIFQGEDGKKYSFSNQAFRDAISAYSESHMCSQNFVIHMISERLYVDDSSVKKWHSFKNGVSDIERVKGIAEVLGINYLELLKPISFATHDNFETIKNEKRGDNMVMSTATNANSIVNEIYEKCVEIIYDVVESHHYSKPPKNMSIDSGYEYYAWKLDQIKRLLNYKALVLSKEQFNKLFEIVCEVEIFVKMEGEEVCVRWKKDNPLLTKLIQYSLEANTVEQLTWDYTYNNENEDSDDPELYMEKSAEEKELESVMNAVAISSTTNDIEWLCCSRYLRTTEILANEIVKTITPYFE